MAAPRAASGRRCRQPPDCLDCDRRANEASRLPARIENLLALDYPADRRQIIVVSDGSTDDTLAVLGTFGSAVEAVAAPARGKAAAVNVAVARATGGILIFADARQMFAPDALRELVAPFADPAIGGVTGELLLDCEASEVAGRRVGAERRRVVLDRRTREDRGPCRRDDLDRRGRFVSTIAEGVGLYWRYEKRLRRFESAVGSTLGATGAIYALRRALSTVAGRHDSRRCADADAGGAGGIPGGVQRARVCVRPRGGRCRAEQRRKCARSPATCRSSGWNRGCSSRSSTRSGCSVSHKIGRLMVPYALLALFTTSVALAGRA